MDEQPGAAAGFFMVGSGTLAAIAVEGILAMLSSRGEFVTRLQELGLFLFLLLPLAIGAAQLQRASHEGLDAYRRGVIAGMIVFPLLPIALFVIGIYIFTNRFMAF